VPRRAVRKHPCILTALFKSMSALLRHERPAHPPSQALVAPVRRSTGLAAAQTQQAVAAAGTAEFIEVKRMAGPGRGWARRAKRAAWSALWRCHRMLHCGYLLIELPRPTPTYRDRWTCLSLWV
jgi:hypothetical protein